MSLEKSIKDFLMGESANFADASEYNHQWRHHNDRSIIHGAHSGLYRDDTEDGRALKNYHSTRSELHRRIADSIDSLRDHVKSKDHPAVNTVATATTPGQMR